MKKVFNFLTVFLLSSALIVPLAAMEENEKEVVIDLTEDRTDKNQNQTGLRTSRTKYPMKPLKSILKQLGEEKPEGNQKKVSFKRRGIPCSPRSRKEIMVMRKMHNKRKKITRLLIEDPYISNKKLLKKGFEKYSIYMARKYLKKICRDALKLVVKEETLKRQNKSKLGQERYQQSRMIAKCTKKTLDDMRYIRFYSPKTYVPLEGVPGVVVKLAQEIRRSAIEIIRYPSDYYFMSRISGKSLNLIIAEKKEAEKLKHALFLRRSKNKAFLKRELEVTQALRERVAWPKETDCTGCCCCCKGLFGFLKWFF